MRSAARRTEASEEQAERMRTRVRLLVQLTTRHGRYRRGLVQAAKSLAPEEAAVLADLEAHGLDVNQLRDVLCGGHVLVDNPDLYERWRFPKVTRQRLSSHHRTVDKVTYPDLGMHGRWCARSCTDGPRPAPGCSLRRPRRRSVRGTGCRRGMTCCTWWTTSSTA